MRTISLILLLSFSSVVQAHAPDLSNLMIYEQNGHYFLIIKSSLTAFESEINYRFGKNSYKSPQDFQDLVIQHFQQNCNVLINDDTLKFHHPYVNLGHETTFFAALSNIPQNLHSIEIKNTMFKDMPMNMSELILMLKNLPQKQVILNNDNQHQIKLIIQDNNWIEARDPNWLGKNSSIIFKLFFILSFIAITLFAIRKFKLNLSMRPGRTI